MLAILLGKGLIINRGSVVAYRIMFNQIDTNNLDKRKRETACFEKKIDQNTLLIFSIESFFNKKELSFPETRVLRTFDTIDCGTPLFIILVPTLC